MKKTNFDLYLEEQLKDLVFAERFEKAGEAWDVALQIAALGEKAGLSQKGLARKRHTSQPMSSNGGHVSSFSSGDNPVGRAGSGRERLAATYARPGSRKREACQITNRKTEGKAKGNGDLTTDKTGFIRMGMGPWG